MPYTSCPACNKGVSPEDMFCRHCGLYLGTGPVERYMCNRCGHLNYVDLIKDKEKLDEKLERCRECDEGFLWHWVEEKAKKVKG